MSGSQAVSQTGTLQLGAGGTKGLPVSFGYYPPEGSRVSATQYAFNGSQTSFYEDLSTLKNMGIETAIQSLWIDNSMNNGPVIITVQGSNQVITCPANYQGIAPAFFMDSAAFNISSSGIGITKIVMLNVPCNSAGFWPTTPVAEAMNGNGAFATPLLGTRTFGSNVGIDSTIIPGIAGERFFISSVIINLSGNATLATAGILNVELNDGGSAIFQAIPFVGITAGAPSQTLLSVSGLNIISAAPGNSLTSVLNVALITGTLSIMVFGGYTTQAQ
jgi:hypothetical protein